MREMITLDQLPPPSGAKKGRYAYVPGHPAPIWHEDRFDWGKLLSRAALGVGILTGLITAAKTFGLL